MGYPRHRVRLDGTLTHDQVASLGHGAATDTCWPADDAALIAAVDALVDGAELDDDTWLRLVDAVGEEGALDLLLVCGCISFVANEPPGSSRNPAPPLSEHGGGPDPTGPGLR